VRKLGVWLPPQYDEGGDKRRFPVLYDLVGFTGSGLAHLNWKPFGDNVPERLARLTREEKMGPVIAVFPDCFTALGGNQYVKFIRNRKLRPTTSRARSCRSSTANSARLRAGTSRLFRQIIRWLRRHPARHEVRQDLGAVASHSGDAAFDFVYWADWRTRSMSLRVFRAPKRKPGAYDARAEAGRKGLAEGLDDGRIKRFLAHVWKKEKVSMKETMCS